MTKVSTKATPKRRQLSAEHRAKLSEAAKRQHARRKAEAVRSDAFKPKRRQVAVEKAPDLPQRLMKRDAIKAELQALRVKADHANNYAHGVNNRIAYLTQRVARRDWVLSGLLGVLLVVNVLHYIAWFIEVN